MSVRLIAELGSCHMGKLSYIKEAIDRCKAAGIDALKLQLFPNEDKYTSVGNVWLDPSDYFAAVSYGRQVGLPVGTSVFSNNLLEVALSAPGTAFIKFAYSQKDSTRLIERSLQFMETIVSCDVMTEHLVPQAATKLYCIAEYPVQYQVAFDELFTQFDGFSDHTLGTRQTVKAIQAGAQIIEKHVRLGKPDETCPDARFAVLIEEFGRVRDGV